MGGKKEFQEQFKQTYKKPYPKTNNPSLGANALINNGWECVRVELVAAGSGKLNNVPVEFVDVRMFLAEKAK